jgi:hypothetical protein
VDVGESRVLAVDWGAFSVYAPGRFRTHQYFDYLLVAPLLREDPPHNWLRNVLIVGLGSGTVAKQLTQAYGPLPIDGVEIDPAIVELGRRYFDMNEPNLSVHVTDGRAFLGSGARRYDWVVIDAYQGSDIPFHLVTREFFETVREHMSPGGVLSVNIAWWCPDDEELLQRVAATIATTFPSVYVLAGISARSGAVLLAGGDDLAVAHILLNADSIGHPGLIEIARDAVGDHSGLRRLSVIEGSGVPLTDDRAPIEEIADRLYREMREEQYQRERKCLAH